MKIGVLLPECVLQMAVTCTKLARRCCKRARLQMQAIYHCCSLQTAAVVVLHVTCIVLLTQAEST